MRYTSIAPGKRYLLPSGRLALCYAVGQVYAAFEYTDRKDEVTLCLTFAMAHLVDWPSENSNWLYDQPRRDIG